MVKIYYTETSDHLDRLDQLWSLLNSEEQARAERFVFDHDQQQCIIGHALKRIQLSQWLQVDPAELVFGTGDKGKPFLIDHTLEFNMSNSHGAILMGISELGPIGVDIEKMRAKTDFHSLATRYFTPNEANHLQQLSGEELMQQFYRYWVAKEAILKAQGEGIADFLAEVELNPSGVITHLPAPFPALDQWKLIFEQPTPEILCAVAIPTPNVEVDFSTQRLAL